MESELSDGIAPVVSLAELRAMYKAAIAVTNGADRAYRAGWPTRDRLRDALGEARRLELEAGRHSWMCSTCTIPHTLCAAAPATNPAGKAAGGSRRRAGPCAAPAPAASMGWS